MDQYTRKTSLPQRRATLANIADSNQYLASLRQQQPMSAIRQKRQSNFPQAGRVSKVVSEVVNPKGFGRAGRSSIRPSSALQTIPQDRINDNNNVRQKDCRPLRDKQYQMESINLIIDFLRNSNYPYPIEQRNLSSPIAKDFLNIFRFLYNRLEPYKDILKTEDIAGALKAIKYPFIHDVSKSSLQAVGNQQTWPILLGMLRWLVEVVAMWERVETLENDQNVMSLEFLFFNYLADSYELFLNGADEYPEQDEELSINFERMCEELIKTNDELQSAVNELENELNRMSETKDPLTEVRNDNQTLRSDMDKFNSYTKHLEEKKKKLSESITKLEDQQRTIESEQITNKRNVIAGKMKEINKLQWEKKLDVEKEIIELEHLIQSHNSNLFRIGLLPSSSRLANGENFELSINVEADRIEKIISLDLKDTVRNKLAEVRKEFINELDKTQEQMTRANEDVQHLIDDIGDKESDLHNLEETKNSLSKQFDELKESDQKEYDNLVKRIVAFEQGVKQSKSKGNSNYIECKQKRQEIQIHYDHISREYHNARDAAINEFNQIKNDQVRRLQNISAAITSLTQLSRDYLKDVVKKEKHQKVHS
ncbi:7705_t:CDS:10 [Rhizophagus irregularis]|nr:7705_t:CDS:10 [Rhizophagus irregularis]